MELKNGKKVSWMKIADEGSTAHLKAVVQQEAVMASIKLESAIEIVNECFNRWGLPNWTFDNSRCVEFLEFNHGVTSHYIYN